MTGTKNQKEKKNNENATNKHLYDYLSKLSIKELTEILKLQKLKLQNQVIKDLKKNNFLKLNGQLFLNLIKKCESNSEINLKTNENMEVPFAKHQKQVRDIQNSSYQINLKFNNQKKSANLIYSKKIEYKTSENPFSKIHQRNMEKRICPLRLNKNLLVKN